MKSYYRVGLWLGVMVLLVPLRVVQAQWVEEQKLLASDWTYYDEFGTSVSLSGDRALVGSPMWNFDDFSGSAYVFRYDGTAWVEEQKLKPSDVFIMDHFGYSVWLSGDLALVGAIYDDDNGGNGYGSAYVFRYDGTTWVEEQKLLPSDGADEFGSSVSLSGDLALVGASYDDDNGYKSGSAYVFRYDGSTWVEEQKLLASDGAVDDFFGTSVALSGDLALVGADGNDDNGDNSGSAYVFRYDGTTWVEEQKLLPSDEADEFGSSVSLSGDLALVGASYDDDNGYKSGSAYVFRYDGSTWVEEQKLLPADGDEFDYFGRSVTLSGNLALVGTTGKNAGYMFRYDGTTWVEEQKLLPSDGADEFGSSVSLSGDLALVGARWDDDYSGSAYVFAFNAPEPELVDLTLTPLDDPVVIPPEGGTLAYELDITNATDAPQAFQHWTEMTYEDAVITRLSTGPFEAELAAGQTKTQQVEKTLGGRLHASSYTYCGYVGMYPDDILDSDCFSFTKQSAVTNVAWHAMVSLDGAPFFTGGWGGGETVEAFTVVDGVFLPRHTQWDQGGVWWDNSDGQDREIVLDLGSTFVIESLVVQADDNDSYLLSYWDLDEATWHVLWEVPYAGSCGDGMQTRPSCDDNMERYLLSVPIITNVLRFESIPGEDTFYSVSEIQAYGEPLVSVASANNLKRNAKMVAKPLEAASALIHIPGNQPRAFTLAPNYPNPFNPTTEIGYALPEASHVRLVVYNMLGQQVARLIDGYQVAGAHQARFDASRLSAGVYFYVIEADGFTATGRMTLLK